MVRDKKKLNEIDDEKKKLKSLNIIVCSGLRRDILLELYKGKKPLSDLRVDLDKTSTTTLHALKDLENYNFVFQGIDKKYSLTNIGRIAATKLLDLVDTVETLAKHQTFWLEHDMSGIPDHLLEKIGWLKDSDIVQIDALDILGPHSVYINHIKNAMWIKGVSPIYYADYPKVFKDIVEHDVSTQLILTKAVFEKLNHAVGTENLNDLINNYHLEIFITDENLQVAFTATDIFLSFDLFTNEGVYDNAYGLIDTNKKGIRWGIQLFDHHRKKAKKYNI